MRRADISKFLIEEIVKRFVVVETSFNQKTLGDSTKPVFVKIRV